METQPETQKVDAEARKLQRLKNIEASVSQGVLPFHSLDLFEQANPLVRSAVFKSNNRTGFTDEWTPIFSWGNDTILFKGPHLNTDHEDLWAKLLSFARGKSLTKPVNASYSDLLREMDMADSGKNYTKIKRMLNDLESAKIQVSSRPALTRLLRLMTDPNIEKSPDGVFFKQFIANRYGEQIKMIAESLQNGQPVEITMSFINNRTKTPRTKRELINLDPITCLFFDGVNTTLIPYEIRNKLNPFGKKLISFLKSHKEAVNIKLQNLYELTGWSQSPYEDQGRKFKAYCLVQFKQLTEEGHMVEGWGVRKNKEGEWVAINLGIGEQVRNISQIKEEAPVLAIAAQDDTEETIEIDPPVLSEEELPKTFPLGI